MCVQSGYNSLPVGSFCVLKPVQCVQFICLCVQSGYNSLPVGSFSVLKPVQSVQFICLCVQSGYNNLPVGSFFVLKPVQSVQFRVCVGEQSGYNSLPVCSLLRLETGSECTVLLVCVYSPGTTACRCAPSPRCLVVTWTAMTWAQTTHSPTCWR